MTNQTAKDSQYVAQADHGDTATVRAWLQQLEPDQ